MSTAGTLLIPAHLAEALRSASGIPALEYGGAMDR